MTEMKEENDVQFGIHRIYVKDISFESPGAPDLFRESWKPKVNMELETRSEKLEEGVFEVTLEVTATAKHEDKIGFLIELEQAGIFTIKGLSEESLRKTLGAYCPNMLFAYARETIDSLAVKGSFPPLMIAPVNFDHLYEESLTKKKTS